ncbi:MAG: rseP [Mucilaginibacter sp.]|nr:rseP [Mucilaginibacter sp.]
MSIVIMVGQLILGLSILVILHELGHFLAARAFGIKVEKFYLFLMHGISACLNLIIKVLNMA